MYTIRMCRLNLVTFIAFKKGLFYCLCKPLEVSHINVYYSIYTNFISISMALSMPISGFMSTKYYVIYEYFFNPPKANVVVECVLIMQQLQVYKTEIRFTSTDK